MKAKGIRGKKKILWKQERSFAAQGNISVIFFRLLTIRFSSLVPFKQTPRTIRLSCLGVITGPNSKVSLTGFNKNMLQPQIHIQKKNCILNKFFFTWLHICSLVGNVIGVSKDVPHVMVKKVKDVVTIVQLKLYLFLTCNTTHIKSRWSFDHLIGCTVFNHNWHHDVHLFLQHS